MGHTDPHAVPFLQQGLDRLARRTGVLLVIAFQPGTDRTAHFDGMSLASVVHGLFSALQHPLPQPIRGRPTHLDPCRLHRFAPRVSLKHGASHLHFCDSMISCLHGGLLPADGACIMQRLACNTPDGTKRAVADAGECHQPPRGRTTASGAPGSSPTSRRWGAPPACGVYSRADPAGLSDDGATLAALKAIESLATHHREPAGWFMPPRLSAKEGGVWRTPQTLPSSLKRLRERAINSAVAPARPTRRAPAPKSPHRCPSRSTGTSRSGSQADRSDSWPARRWLEDIA